MPKIIFDTAIGSTNLGDHIIMDAVNPIADQLFEDDFVINIATHQWIHPLDLMALRKYDLALVGGTNLLKNDNLLDSQWKIGFKEITALRHKVVLFGVGWWQYQSQKVSSFSKTLYRSLLSDQYLHAVRDGYTQKKLASIGINNVVNTGCPTVWGLTAAHCAEIKIDRHPLVVTTITDYLRDPQRDKMMLETLKQEYEQVHVWLQGSRDLQYVNQLTDGLSFIPPKLSTFDRFLEENACDYVGTRLHAGIRALQKKRRALIIGIDNRATEMHKDIGLPVLERMQIESLQERIHDHVPIQLDQPWENIQTWKSQFKTP